MNSAFEFDFDDWAELSRRDPEAFARRRDRVVNEARERLSGSRYEPAISGSYGQIEALIVDGT